MKEPLKLTEMPTDDPYADSELEKYDKPAERTLPFAYDVVVDDKNAFPFRKLATRAIGWAKGQHVSLPFLMIYSFCR
jgi:hypothetical protein